MLTGFTLLAIALALCIIWDGYCNHDICPKCGQKKIPWRDADLVCPHCDLV